MGLAFDGKVGLGPFWTLVQVLLYNDVVHAPSAPPSPPSGTRVQLHSERSKRGCKCKI
jgi:hypothetical protein